MVFYFSGTGNSFWVARMLSGLLGEPLTSIADELKKQREEYICPLREEEKVVFVFPVHSWGPAVLALRFISRLTLTGYQGQPVYAVCTCGDDCGYTSRMVGEALEKRGIRLTAAYSVQMPNNYILMPGFDVDPKEIEKEKLAKAHERVSAIANAIRKDQNVNFYHTGSFPFLKSRLVYPLFRNFALGKNAFYVTDACISCGLCEKVCPTGTIRMSEQKRPVWANTCIQCVACIHRCPVRAIEYGKQTQKKGRYHHPEIVNK